ncbi:MAG: DUF3293 domain-containing protein [Rhodospirillaceae bacterium]|nr:DUF3293 domain-containing protein [Rhodospirillaceae bacterium]
MTVPPDLIAAYRAAIYEIDANGEPLAFHVDRPSARVDALLAAHGAAEAVLITAYNPRSKIQSEEKNALAHGALIEAVRAVGKDYVLTRARDPGDNGPTEAGLFVFDLSRDGGLALARRFGQYAIVYVEKGAPPALAFAD